MKAQCSRAIHLRKFSVAAIFLGLALVPQPGFAEKVVLGGAYNVFGDYFIVTTTSDPLQNCTNMHSALANAPGGGTIKLPPAMYGCGEDHVIVPSGITLEGSGQQTTRIVGQLDFDVLGAAFVDVQSGAELNNLTVENTLASDSTAVAIQARCGSTLNHVGVEVTSSNSWNIGAFLYKVSEEPCPTAPTKLHDVTIRVSAGSANNYGLNASSDEVVSLDTVNIQSSQAGIVVSANDALSIRNSVVDGDVGAISSESNNAVEIQHSQLIGGVGGTGTFKCFSVSDANFDALLSNCTPPLR